MSRTLPPPPPQGSARSARVLAERRAAARLVKAARLLLPVGLVAVIAAIVVWPGARTVTVTPPSAPDPASQDVARMVAPRFTGVDGRDRPYEVTAASARQTGTAGGIVELTRPAGALSSPEGLLTVAAAVGQYAPEARTLHLAGDVTLARAGDLRVTLPALSVDLETQVAEGTGPVAGQGARVALSGAAVRYDGRTGALTLSGPATLVLRPAPEVAP